MKILITGASGYLGQHFLKAAIEKYENLNSNEIEIFATFGSLEGFADAVVSSFESGESSSITVKIDKLDLTNESEVKSYIASNGPFQICFHLAAMASPKLCQQNEEKCRDLNIPKHFFESLRGTCVVALSTDQVYCGDKSPYVESDEVGPKNAYAQSKRDMEHELFNDTKRSKPVVCLRSSIILGPLVPYDDNAHSTFLHFCKSRQGVETTFFTDEIRSVIAVKDVVNILLHFSGEIESGNEFISGVYNMGGQDSCSRMDMAVAVADHCIFPHEKFFIPAQKAKIERGVNDVPSPLDISMNSSKLESLVGWKFSGLKEIVKAALN